MDIFNEDEAKVLAEIVESGDRPLLMINLNRYKPDIFPDGFLYCEWRKVNKEMIDAVGGKIIWTLPIRGYILANGPQEPLDEILAYWYPSHQCFLEMRELKQAKKNFEIRKDLIDYAIVHRSDGENPPMMPK